MARVIVIAILCLLTIYAPLELSRHIICYGLEEEFVGELLFIWGCYLGALIIMTKVVKV